ncbi:MAG: hypothetical protein LBE05_05720 [Microbacterium sp.]|nr:hypothetical protein [Microbacterium sp.]
MAEKTKTEVVEYDFDNWSQEAEDAALLALSDVKHIIVEGDFVGRFADGAIMRIPLKLSLAQIDELQEKFDNPIDQFRHLVNTFAGDAVAETLNDRNLISVSVMTEKYFRALKRAQELSFPES